VKWHEAPECTFKFGASKSENADTVKYATSRKLTTRVQEALGISNHQLKVTDCPSWQWPIEMLSGKNDLD
jgi:hypothetical protein